VWSADKARLLAATLDLPFDPRAGGTRLATEFLARFERGEGFIALSRAASSSAEAAAAIRDFLAARIGIDEPAEEVARRLGPSARFSAETPLRAGGAG
jgi:hypothetical protein